VGNAKLKLYDDMMEGAKSHIKLGNGLWWKMFKTLLQILSNVLHKYQCKDLCEATLFCNKI
jgi:hypothetical protein